MNRVFVLVALVATAVGAAVVVVDATVRGGADDKAATRSAPTSGHISDPTNVVSGGPLDRPGPGLEMKGGSEKEVGAFELRNGRKLRLHTADTIDGRSCVIDVEPSTGSSSMCLEGGLFELRRAAFFVSSNGGPERFSELQFGGVAAPSIGSVTLVKTDGSSVVLALTAERAFLYESTAAELEWDVLPSALRLYGRSGKLAETIPIPGLR